MLIRLRKGTIKTYRLNLGCGRRKAEGCVNVDIRLEARPDVVADIRALPFREGTADHIGASHVIEHVSHRETDRTLAGWSGLLRNGGTLFLSCPDIGEIAERAGGQDLDKWIRDIFGGQEHAHDFHHCGFTEASLRARLERLGLLITDIFSARGSLSCWAIKVGEK